jgi:peptidoglycan hydrolase-like protein with peptidoglycan-binding domain
MMLMNKQQTMDNRQSGTGAFFLFVVCCSLSVVPFLARAYTFSRDLKEGDTGEDVRALQQMLNSDVRTRVSDLGPGSAGQETAYFGAKTRAAVVRFQELNAGKILTPLGLFAGTGYVGIATRGILSGDTKTAAIPQTSFDTALSAFNQTISGAAAEDTGFYVPPANPMALAKGVTVISMTPTRGTAGTKVTLKGSGFAAKNDIQTNFFVIKDAPSSDGTTIVFTMESPFPKGFDFPPVFKENVSSFFTPVFVENENGHSNPLTFELLFE